MSERSVVVRLQASIGDFRAQMQQAERSVKGVGDSTEKTSQQATTALGRMARSAQDNRGAWDQAGTALTVFGAAATAALAGTIKAAMDWESAWAGVTKTLPDGADFAATEAGLRNLAKTLPATHTEIAAVAEAAGQLGVAADAIVPFTKTMIDLAETTDLTADQAATSIAQLMNVMGTAPDDVGRFGAALVELGNNGASTEADIMSMAQRLSGAGALVGASESDVLALSSAMADLGIEAQLGGGVMTRVLQKIYSASLEGGDAIKGFADVAGMSGAEFAKAFQSDPVRALSMFTAGLNDVETSGGNVVATLSDLGLKGTEEASVLLRMKGASDGLATSLDTSSQAWADNTALVAEAEKRYDTTEAKLAIARNNIVDAGIEIGQVFLPVLADMADGLAGVAGWFADLPDPIQGVLGGLGGVAGVAALAAGGFLLIVPRAIETYKAFQTLNAVSPGVASGLGKVGKAAGIAGAVWAAASAVDGLVNSMRPAPATMEETTAALLAMNNSTGDIDAQFAALGSTFTDIDNLNDAMRRLIDPSVREGLGDWTAKVITLGGAGGNDTFERLSGQFNQIGESLAFMVQSGNADAAAATFAALAEAWEANGGSVEHLLELMPAYEADIGQVENAQRLAADAARLQANQTVLLARDLDASYGSIEGYAAAMGYSEEQTEALVKKTGELGQSLADFINPLGTYTSLLDEKKAAEEAAAISAAEDAGKGADAWRDFVKDTGFSFDEYMKRLEEQVSAQTNWQSNMLRLAGRVSQGTLDELARMGPEGAPLVAELVNRSDAELDVMDDLFYQRSKEATDAMAAQLTLAAPVLAAVGKVAGQGVVDELTAQLMAGTITVAEIARQYGVDLAGGINPVLNALGKPLVNLGRGNFRGRQGGVLFEADGGLVDYLAAGARNNLAAFADGGLRENHVAQIARAGDWRVWAEPETGGPAFIPLAHHRSNGDQS